MKKSILSLFLLLVVTIVICNISEGDDKQLELGLMEAYTAISSSHYTLTYPHSKERLDDCIKNNDHACLGVYKRVKVGRQYLMKQIAARPDKVLAITLDTLFDYCQKEPVRNFKSPSAMTPADRYNLRINSLCLGATLTFYFFDQEKYDQILFDRIKDAPPKVLNKVFHDFEWLYNRPNPQRWVDFIEKLPEDVMTKGGKAFFIERLKMKKGDYEEFGLMLLENGKGDSPGKGIDKDCFYRPPPGQSESTF